MSMVATQAYYIDCDGKGCDASFVDDVNATQEEVESGAASAGWTKKGEAHFCWRHEPEDTGG